MLKKIILLTLAICLAAPVLAGQGRIHGAVVDDGGVPVAGARVEVHREISGYVLTAFTTDKGEYAFNDVPSGIYAVQVTLKGVVLGGERAELLVPVNGGWTLSLTRPWSVP